jgi:hypothetical protein
MKYRYVKYTMEITQRNLQDGDNTWSGSGQTFVPVRMFITPLAFKCIIIYFSYIKFVSVPFACGWTLTHLSKFCPLLYVASDLFWGVDKPKTLFKMKRPSSERRFFPPHTQPLTTRQVYIYTTANARISIGKLFNFLLTL